jgi:hypothetical protein
MQATETILPTEQDTELDIQELRSQIDELEVEMNKQTPEVADAWVRGYEAGRDSVLRQLKEDFYPSDEYMFRAAEIAYTMMSRKFGDIFQSVHMGFNHHFDDPTILFALNAENSGRRVEIANWAFELEMAMFKEGLTMAIFVTRGKDTDIDTVKSDMPFQRIANA